MRRVLWLCILAIAVGCSLAASISSKIDLESSEEGSIKSSTTALEASDDLDRASVDGDRTRGPDRLAVRSRAVPQFVRPYSFDRRRINVARSDLRKPTVINNVHIVVNGNETNLDSSVCNKGICDVSVNSKPDGNGNIITDVHLTIVTKLRTADVEEIPVIDGLRGVESSQGPDRIFPSTNLSPPFIQSRDSSDGNRWFQDRKLLPRRPYLPRPRWSGRDNVGFQNENQNGSIDDKIGSPLSKTNDGKENSTQ